MLSRHFASRKRKREKGTKEREMPRGVEKCKEGKGSLLTPQQGVDRNVKPEGRDEG